MRRLESWLMDFSWSGVGDVVGDFAVLELVYFGGKVVAGGIVAGHEDGDALLGDELCEEFEDLAAGLAVEVAGGLVGDEHGGAVGEARAMERRCCWPPDISKGL